MRMAEYEVLIPLVGGALEMSLELAGVRLLLVHAVNQAARKFYLRFGFEPSPTDELNLQLLLKDVRASLDAAARN
jgi:hypothetical protein